MVPPRDSENSASGKTALMQGTPLLYIFYTIHRILKEDCVRNSCHFLKSSAPSTDEQLSFEKKVELGSKGRDPPTTQASSAKARSSRPRYASRAQGTGATKIR